MAAVSGTYRGIGGRFPVDYCLHSSCLHQLRRETFGQRIEGPTRLWLHIWTKRDLVKGISMPTSGKLILRGVWGALRPHLQVSRVEIVKLRNRDEKTGKNYFISLLFYVCLWRQCKWGGSFGFICISSDTNLGKLWVFPCHFQIVKWKGKCFPFFLRLIRLRFPS